MLSPTTMSRTAARLACTGLAVLLPSLAVADDRSGWYAQGGVSRSSASVDDSTVRGGAGPGVDLVLVPEVDDDIGFFAGIGYDFGMFRIESEYLATGNDAQDYTIKRPVSATLPLGGEAELDAFMLNGFIDVPLGDAGDWGLFLGAGVGRGELSLDLSGPPLPGAPSIPLIDDSDTGTAYQLIGGVSYAFTPGFDAFLQYRYLNLDDLEGQDTRGLPFETGTDYDFWELGLRLRF